MSRPKLLMYCSHQFAQVHRIIAKDPDLTLQEKGLYLLCVSFCKPTDDGLSMFAGVSLLAQISGRSESYISKTLASLIEKKLIWRHRRIGTSSMTYLVDPVERYGTEVMAEQVVESSTNMNSSDGRSSTIVTGEGKQVEGKKEEGSGKSATIDLVIDGWNEVAEHHGLSKVRKSTKAIRSKIAARLKDPEYRGDFWPEMREKLMTLRPWYLGDNDRGWRINLEYLIRNDGQAQKLLDGEWSEAPRRTIPAQSELPMYEPKDEPDLPTAEEIERKKAEFREKIEGEEDAPW